MPETDAGVIMHRFNVDSARKLVKQKKRTFKPERQSVKAKLHVEDLKETFDILRRYNTKLNPLTCAFGVASEKFQCSIEANPEKIKAIQALTPLRTIKQVQELTSRDFGKDLRRAKDFAWTKECQKSFEELKESLSSHLFLSKPLYGEDLFFYLSIGEVAVNVILAREESNIQKPIYYANKI
ncbi:hypothetical protein RJ639_000806 [Escallonia herrerae]|uniref:Reverse transcriptase/retrotransposon-derived protein RNase H-like domain-containing protein n=1 Tax=Escallonia herrerae TaxID=1293975 RepID=A0AA89BIV2_9ASTE|nr:hypothetical protein RJ639_000806 [Escallonia herrerae]